LRNPITGIVGCCARTASGQTVVVEPTITLMNSRRFMADPGTTRITVEE
jgi:hypothetical protein